MAIILSLEQFKDLVENKFYYASEMSVSSCILNSVAHKFGSYNLMCPLISYHNFSISYFSWPPHILSLSISLLQSASIHFPWVNLELCDRLSISFKLLRTVLHKMVAP